MQKIEPLQALEELYQMTRKAPVNADTHIAMQVLSAELKEFINKHSIATPPPNVPNEVATNAATTDKQI